MMFEDRFGNFINPKAREIRDLISKGEKVIVPYQFSKEDILSENFTVIDSLMNTATQVGKGMRETIVLGCKGYDDIPDELHEIPEVRNYIDSLFNRYPHLPYYLFKNDDADAWIFACIGEVRYLNGKTELTTSQLIEKYGSYNDIPAQPFSVKLSKEELFPLLKATISHGRKNKDAQGAKMVACQYAIRFNLPELISDLKITKEELRGFGFIK